MVTELPPQKPRFRPHRRAVTLAVVSVLVLALALGGSAMPVPYVSLRPGPTMNTLGNGKDGKPLIRISGRETFPDDGHLNFTTVAYTGGPQQPLDLLGALRDWVDPDRAVVPQETLFPKDETVEQVEQENTFQMQDSQQTAIAAALTRLKVPLETVSAVQSVQKGLPAEKALKPGDEIVAIDGVKVDRTAKITAAMKKSTVGAPVVLTVRRDGEEQKVELRSVAAPEGGRPVIGVVLRDKYVFPFEVGISVGDIGGPSAGLMFALGIYDLLTPGTLTGGRFIAGTGTITAEGAVGPIGGIQQKLIGAREAGATVFLVPAGNCADAVRARPDGLELVKAETLDGAVTALEKLAKGDKAGLPRC